MVDNLDKTIKENLSFIGAELLTHPNYLIFAYGKKPLKLLIVANDQIRAFAPSGPFPELNFAFPVVHHTVLLCALG
jgi:predicted Zn-dependent protease